MYLFMGVVWPRADLLTDVIEGGGEGLVLQLHVHGVAE